MSFDLLRDRRAAIEDSLAHEEAAFLALA